MIQSPCVSQAQSLSGAMIAAGTFSSQSRASESASPSNFTSQFDKKISSPSASLRIAVTKQAAWKLATLKNRHECMRMIVQQCAAPALNVKFFFGLSYIADYCGRTVIINNFYLYRLAGVSTFCQKKIMDQRSPGYLRPRPSSRRSNVGQSYDFKSATQFKMTTEREIL